MKTWDSATDERALYDLRNDFSEADNLAAQHPAKLAELQANFLTLAEENKDFPIGAGNWLRLHSKDRVSTPYRKWTFDSNTRRMPEFTAPGLGRESNVFEIDMECGEQASGVLYALGGSGGGLAVYMDKGYLDDLYNMLIIEQYESRSEKPIASGKHRVVVETNIAGPGKPGTVTITIDGSVSIRNEFASLRTAFDTFESLLAERLRSFDRFD